MELPTLIVKVLAKLSPASSLENDKVATGCRLWYDKLQKKVQDKKDQEQSLTIVDKGVSMLGEWYVMVILSVLYFFIINYAQQLMNPGDDNQDDNPAAR
jgi:hypothetical protein